MRLALVALALSLTQPAHATTLAQSVYSYISQLPRHVSDQDEPQAERDARFKTYAQDIAHVSRSIDDAAAAITLGIHEGEHFSRWVMGGCQGKRPKGSSDCDRGKARGFGQLHYRTCPVGWKLPAGSPESNRVLAQCAIRHWRWSFYRCKLGLAGAYSGYWKQCTGLKDVAKRVATHERVVKALGGVEAKGMQ
jgi:hypothetical protein